MEVRSCCCRCCLIARLCEPVLANTFISKAASLIRNPTKRSHRSPSTEQTNSLRANRKEESTHRRARRLLHKTDTTKDPIPPFSLSVSSSRCRDRKQKREKKTQKKRRERKGKKVPNNSRYAPSQHNRNKRSQTTAAQAQPIKHDNT